MDNIIFVPGQFLSTLSLRRATSANCSCHNGRPDFYPRSPCGERHDSTRRTYRQGEFLSTLSLRRATPGKIRIFDDIFNFYPRSPCGERRRPSDLKSRLCVFLSTLSLRRATRSLMLDCGIFDISIHALLAESDFTKSGQGAKSQPISIHALLAESDLPQICQYLAAFHFYPRSPCGERPRTRSYS